MPAYRMKCRKCEREYHRHYSVEEFEKNQYGTANGWGCFDCGYPKMIVMKSNKRVKDGFQPGFQKSIREYCSTYGEYKQKLKERGLIELGYEELPEREEKRESYWTPDVLKRLYNEFGVKFSDREAEELENG